MGDTSKHLTYFKVENFKRFKSFEMNDLGQFNLILGDNNVGKTSVLESLLLANDPDVTISNLMTALCYRNLIGQNETTYGDVFLYKNIKTVDAVPRIHSKYRTKENDRDRYITIFGDIGSQNLNFESHAELDENKVLNTFSTYTKFRINPLFKFPFIPFYRGHDEDLAKFYSNVQANRSLKTNFVNSLKVLLPEIENVELAYQFQSPHLIVHQRNVNEAIPLAFFGDGTLKLFRLLAEIINNKGNRLMIDEIDTGIHYSRLKAFWRVLLIAAKENDVQLFMTTHSDECIKYFKEVLEELSDMQDNARSITLIENPKKEIKAFTYTFEQFKANIDVGNEIRGGAR